MPRASGGSSHAGAQAALAEWSDQEQGLELVPELGSEESREGLEPGEGTLGNTDLLLSRRCLKLGSPGFTLWGV